MGLGSVAVIAFVAVLLLAPTGGAPARGSSDGPSPAQGSPRVSSDAVPLPSGAREHPLPPGSLLRISVTLSPDHPDELSRFLTALSDPSSPEYRRFLSYPQVESRFGPPPSELSAVEAALRSVGGLAITVGPGGLSVRGLVSADGVDRLFGVEPVLYGGASGTQLYTSVGTIRVPPSITRFVTGIDGLSNSAPASPSLVPALPFPHSVRPGLFVNDSRTGDQWFVGSDFSQAFNATALWPGPSSVRNATYPSRIAIATILASSYNQTFGADLPPWDPAVIHQYFLDTLAPGWPIPTVTGVPVPEGGSVPPAPGSLGSLVDSTGFEAENSLDLEMAGSLAPGASLYNFYFSGHLVDGSPSPSLSVVAGYLADDLGAALSYNYAPARLAVVSGSFGLPDLNDTLWNEELATAAAMGVTVVSASGDQGDAPDVLTGRNEGPWPLWPATAAFDSSGVVSVGGVSLRLSGSASGNYTAPPLNATYDPSAGEIAGLSAWYDTTGGPGNYAGTEGGASSIYAEPGWQFHSAAQPAIVNATETQGQSALGRSGPDVAFPANNTVTYTSADANGTVYFELVGGTSVAAPVFAGLLADVVAVKSRSAGVFSGLGFLDPELYRIASYYAAHPGPTDPFVDVTVGSNALFSAGRGWDATTGWGTILAPRLLFADANASIRGYQYTGPTPRLPSTQGPDLTLTVLLLIVGVGGATAVVLAIVFGRPERRPPTYAWAGVPPGAYLSRAGGPGMPPSPGPGLPCHRCGRPRPIDFGPCPTCGAP